MSEERDPYALARLVLDYLRTFAWPVIVLLVLLVYRQDLVSLVSEREFEAFGVRFGPRIEEVRENAEAELADIRELLERQKSAAPAERERITEDLTAKVQRLEENLTREVDQIRQLEEPAAAAPGRPRAAADPASRREEVQRLVNEGFEALIARDAGRALKVFDEAYGRWPEYQNVEEIRRLLRGAGERLNDPDSPQWEAIYRRILTSYSWGMSAEHRAALREQLY